ncbi:MAG: hypothetical protein ACYDAB_14480 [bacterium]
MKKHTATKKSATISRRDLVRTGSGIIAAVVGGAMESGLAGAATPGRVPVHREIAGACEVVLVRGRTALRVYANVANAVAQGVARVTAEAVFARYRAGGCGVALDGEFGEDTPPTVSCKAGTCPAGCVLYAHTRAGGVHGGLVRRVGKQEKMQVGWIYVCTCPQLY